MLLAGNHTIYGVLDIPMLALGVYEETGRVVRGLGDDNHFAVPVWRDLLTRLGAVRGPRRPGFRTARPRTPWNFD